MKKGRENNQFLPRKFVLSEIDNTIKYYVKDKKDPKVRLLIIMLLKIFEIINN